MKRIYILLFLLGMACRMMAQPTSYLVSDFNESSLESMLEICQKGGFEYLLEQTPFSTYGHYQWNPEFATNDKAVARMVQKAEAAGVHLGILVQPDAISENDPYFKPKYSKDFLREGSVQLLSDIDAEDCDIALRRNEVIKDVSSLNLLLIDDELISYGTLEISGDLLLLHRCTRGAYGTSKASHTTRSEAFKIWDSPQRFVAPDGSLRDSVRMHLNRRIEASGVGFALQAGNPGQELLDGALRVRQVERWAEEESLSKAGSLGWIVIRAAEKRSPATSIDDVEWIMSKAVGFDAGYGLLIDKKALREHGQWDEILAKIRQWEHLRSSAILTGTQLDELRDPYQDWHLEQDADNQLVLYQRDFSRRYRCNFVDVDSLLIGAEPWEWKAEEEGRFGLRLQVDGKTLIKNPMLNTEKGLVMFPCVIKPGQHLVYDFEDVAYLMDENCHVLQEIAIEGISALPAGTSTVSFICETEKEGDVPEVTMRYVTSSLMVRYSEENHHK